MTQSDALIGDDKGRMQMQITYPVSQFRRKWQWRPFLSASMAVLQLELGARRWWIVLAAAAADSGPQGKMAGRGSQTLTTAVAAEVRRILGAAMKSPEKVVGVEFFCCFLHLKTGH